MDRGPDLGIGNLAVVSGNFKHSNARELRDLTPNTSHTLHRHRNGLAACWLGPAEVLHKEVVEVELLEPVAEPGEIDGHSVFSFLLERGGLWPASVAAVSDRRSACGDRRSPLQCPGGRRPPLQPAAVGRLTTAEIQVVNLSLIRPIVRILN